MNHVFQTIMELKELNRLCKHNEKRSEAANLVFQLMFVLNLVKHKFFPVSIVKHHKILRSLTKFTVLQNGKVSSWQVLVT